MEGVRQQCPEEEEDLEGGRPSKWRGLRRGRGGQMRFILGNGDVGEQEGGGEGRARDQEGREPGQEADGRLEQEEDREGVEEGEGAAEGGGRESAAREGEEEQDRGAEAWEGREGDGSKRGRQKDQQEPPERLQRGEDKDGRPKRKRVRGVRYGEERIGREEPGAVREGVMVYGPHKVRGKWKMYVGTVEELIEQQDRTGHVTKAAIVRWEEQRRRTRRDCRTRWRDYRYACKVGRWRYTGSWFRNRRCESWKVRRCQQEGKVRSTSDN